MAELPASTALRDPWEKLRKLTPARVALGRAGGSVPTGELLKFQLDHARARDAVHVSFDGESVRDRLIAAGAPAVILRTCANDRTAYLKDPDLGRRLADESRARRAELAAADPPTVVLIVSDGLSALAAERHAVGLATDLHARMSRGGRSVAPVAVVPFARVALEDEIGEVLRAQVAVILLGERPGLGTADSLGAYLVFGPRRGRTDAERNCVSNIRIGGLEPKAAADTIAWMIEQMLSRRVSGVALKDDRLLSR